MVSKTKTKARLRNKTHPSLKETCALAIKNPAWERVAHVLGSSTRRRIAANLSQIEKVVAEGDTLIVPGKILSSGHLSKKVVLCALAITPAAQAKLKESKSTFVPLITEIEKNKNAQGVKFFNGK